MKIAKGWATTFCKALHLFFKGRRRKREGDNIDLCVYIYMYVCMYVEREGEASRCLIECASSSQTAYTFVWVCVR